MSEMLQLSAPWWHFVLRAVVISVGLKSTKSTVTLRRLVLLSSLRATFFERI